MSEAEHNITANLLASEFLRRAFANSFGIRGWAAKVADFLEESRRRAAIALHLSQEAARHSHAPAGRSVAATMAVYARQMHLRLIWSQEELAAASPGALMAVVRGGFPAFTGPQRRRLTKRINRMKGHTA